MGKVLYVHKTPDNIIFYIGIGTNKRSREKTGRSVFWNRVVKKYGYNIEILSDNLTWENAQEAEIQLIKLYGRRDLGLGELVNMTDGGDGRFGSIFSLETKLKMSNAKLGKKRPKDIGIKISKNKLGKKHSVEGRNKKVKALGKKVIDTETNKIYLSITEASLAFNIAPGMLSRYLSGKRNNKTTLKYL